jgi:cystathionine gamma-synthase
LIWRAKQCNQNALAVVEMLHGHPLIKRLNYPSVDESLPIYKSLMRKDGGYGHVLSIIFHDEKIAQRFYDNLDIPKGSSFGTNFTIAVPFALLVHYYNREKVAAHGLPEHIIRFSIGLENVEEIKTVIQSALATVTDLKRDSRL